MHMYATEPEVSGNKNIVPYRLGYRSQRHENKYKTNNSNDNIIEK